MTTNGFHPFFIHNPMRRCTYLAVRRLGDGGFGDVFDAVGNGVHVAIKVIRRTGDWRRDFASWQRDQQAHLDCWDHPNIVQSFDQFISVEGHLALVTELANGSLHELVTSHGALTFLQVCDLGSDIAAALEHAHSRPLIHRDVTPKNILWFNDGIFKLNDFGICKNAAVAGGIARSMIGVPSFMPPELVTNQFWVVQSDIYQLGMTLLTALTGEYPIPLHVTQAEAHRMVRDGVPRQIAESLIPDCGPIARLIAMMLRRRLPYRLASAGPIRNAFLQIADSISARAN